MTFEIETTSHCENGISPRWIWWIRGIAGTPRFGLVGTDEQGQGLYIYEHDGDRQPRREPLPGCERFSVPLDFSKSHANALLIEHLVQIGWKPPSAPPGTDKQTLTL
ncbi:hypothetical protein [Uliginosibacterium sediminicola]|uniref:Uncharacterized protein n=1 Tax=Uliginosibacterium sediminicola TaxID=2024550 RepID=A0ABU9Z1R4_9RHOO